MRVYLGGVLAGMLALSACSEGPNGAAGAAPADESVTLAEFQALKSGMSYAEAVAVIGFEGVEQSSSEIGGTKTVMYTWVNPPGFENMNAMFQNDKLITKAQLGLK